MNSEAQFRPWHVAFEGPIAAGKTTLAKLLAAVTGARELLETFETNTFLADFYADRQRWALAMQLEFLLSRRWQFATAEWLNTRVVADHTFAKDRLFARILLSGGELALYERICDAVSVPEAQPSLIVFLDAPDDVLLDRIRLRARPYERDISAEYLQRLRNAYEREFLAMTTTVIMRVNTAEVDLEDREVLQGLFDKIVCSIPMNAAELGP
jgi:deoxyadenosine/deoxycytidine kinase